MEIQHLDGARGAGRNAQQVINNWVGFLATIAAMWAMGRVEARLVWHYDLAAPIARATC